MIEKKCLTLQKILPGVASQLAKDESARQRFLTCETCFKVIQAIHPGYELKNKIINRINLVVSRRELYEKEPVIHDGCCSPTFSVWLHKCKKHPLSAECGRDRPYRFAYVV